MCKTQKSYATKHILNILALQLAICIRYFTPEICHLLSSTEAIFVGSNIVEKSVYPGFLMIVFSHKNDRLKIEVKYEFLSHRNHSYTQVDMNDTCV